MLSYNCVLQEKQYEKQKNLSFPPFSESLNLIYFEDHTDSPTDCTTQANFIPLYRASQRKGVSYGPGNGENVKRIQQHSRNI
jgi:hypothetical protein